jgi:protein gp37
VDLWGARYPRPNGGLAGAVSSWKPSIDWVIFGGESGSKARVLDVDWIRDGLQCCRAAGAAPFVKQLGANIMGREMDKWVTRIKDKKGGDWSEWPEDLRVREFPI